MKNQTMIQAKMNRIRINKMKNGYLVEAIGKRAIINV